MLSLISTLVPAILFLCAAALAVTILVRSVQRFRRAFTGLREALRDVKTVQTCHIALRTTEVCCETASVQAVALLPAPRRISRPALPLAA